MRQYDYALGQPVPNRLRFYVSLERIPRGATANRLEVLEGRAALRRIIQEKLVGGDARDRYPSAAATILSIFAEIVPAPEIPATHWLTVGVQETETQELSSFFRAELRLDDGKRSPQALAILMGGYVQKYVFSTTPPRSRQLSEKECRSLTIGILLALFSGWAYERGLSRQAMIALTTLGYRDRVSSSS